MTVRLNEVAGRLALKMNQSVSWRKVGGGRRPSASPPTTPLIRDASMCGYKSERAYRQERETEETVIEKIQ